MKYSVKCEEYDHPMYNTGTLFIDDNNKGLVIVQKRFNADSKIMWYGPLDWYLAKDIRDSERFDEFFKAFAADKNSNGCFPTYHIRLVMRALSMKPIPKADWEKF